MKKNLFTLIALIYGGTSYGQSILEGDINQGEKLIEAYFTPMAESFGASLNNGWYNTAKPHSLLGFDLTFTLNTVIIPNSAETFKIGDEFNNVFTSSEDEASTIFGGDETTIMTYTDNTGVSAEFDMPGGFKTPIMPLPMLQAGIGLIKNTEVDIRYMPTLDIGDAGKVDLFGVGIKHDLLQWIPVAGDVIPISLSLQVGYTTLNTELELIEQKISLNTKSTTINLVASKKLLMLTAYAGIGYNSATTTFASDANFDLDGVQFDKKVEMKFESNNNLRTNIGLRFNLAIIALQANHTFSKYPVTTVGVGVSLR